MADIEKHNPIDFKIVLPLVRQLLSPHYLTITPLV